MGFPITCSSRRLSRLEPVQPCKPFIPPSQQRQFDGGIGRHDPALEHDTAVAAIPAGSRYGREGRHLRRAARARGGRQRTPQGPRSASTSSPAWAHGRRGDPRGQRRRSWQHPQRRTTQRPSRKTSDSSLRRHESHTRVTTSKWARAMRTSAAARTSCSWIPCLTARQLKQRVCGKFRRTVRAIPSAIGFIRIAYAIPCSTTLPRARRRLLDGEVTRFGPF